MNLMISQQRIDELASFEHHSDDIFVVSYPKSGMTWTQQIVKLILSNGVDDGVALFRSFPWIEVDTRERERIGIPPLDFKVLESHLLRLP